MTSLSGMGKSPSESLLAKRKGRWCKRPGVSMQLRDLGLLCFQFFRQGRLLWGPRPWCQPDPAHFRPPPSREKKEPQPATELKDPARPQVPPCRPRVSKPTQLNPILPANPSSRHWSRLCTKQCAYHGSFVFLRAPLAPNEELI